MGIGHGNKKEWTDRETDRHTDKQENNLAQANEENDP